MARDTGEMTISSTLDASVSFAGADQHRVAVVLLPIYRSGSVPDTVEARRRALVGFVLAPMRVTQLLENVSRGISADVLFDVYDRTTQFESELLVASDVDRGPYHLTQSVRIADRHWIVLLSSRGRSGDAISRAAQRTHLLGFAFSLLLCLISYVQIRAWRTSAAHEAELGASALALKKTETDLRTMIELERHARKEAQTASRAKDEFLTMVSHELRTPLNAVVGWVSMLRSGAVREERQAHALETIERNARAQAQLIEDLLDVSRFTMGKTRLDLRPINLDPIVTAVIDSLRPAAEARHVTMTTTFATSGNTIRADAVRVQQIVWNLVSNAIKFTPPDGRIEVQVSAQDGRVRLVVRDTGIGINPQFLPHVFERFKQADSSTTRAYTGIGLGLAIVRELVDLHGGTITADSEGENRGATLTVEFPSVEAASHVTRPPVEASSVVPSLEGIAVLVVDDDPTTRELMSEALAAMQAKALPAASTREALERLATEHVDVVVSDIAMPDEDGLSLIRRIRELPGQPGRIPAIALSAYARAEDRERAVQAGFQLSLTKPVALSELQDSIADLVGRAAPFSD